MLNAYFFIYFACHTIVANIRIPGTASHFYVGSKNTKTRTRLGTILDSY